MRLLAFIPLENPHSCPARRVSLTHLTDRPRRAPLPQPVTPPSPTSPWKETDISSNVGLPCLCICRVPGLAGAPTSHFEAFEALEECGVLTSDRRGHAPSPRSCGSGDYEVFLWWPSHIVEEGALDIKDLTYHADAKTQDEHHCKQGLTHTRPRRGPCRPPLQVLSPTPIGRIPTSGPSSTFCSQGQASFTCVVEL